jgi:spermidine synthase
MAHTMDSQFVNSKPDASTSVDLDTQLLIAHTSLFLAPDARTALIIGHGSGITAGSMLRHPLEQANIVEISPAVLSADSMFVDANYAVLNDPRVQTFVDDGQSFLRTVPRRYDVILSQPPNPWIAGVGGLFTVDYFEKVRNRLNPGGVFSFWFHAYEQSDEAVQLIVRTVGSVFPHIMLFGDDDLGNLIAVASMEPIEPDFAKMERRYQDPGIRKDLARLGMNNLVSLLSHHRVSQKQFRQLTGPGPLNTVGHQRLEYMAPRSFFLRENSLYLDGLDPLVKGVPKKTDLMLDRYIAYRAEVGNPITRKELVDAARYAVSMGGYGRQVAKSIFARIH